MDDDATAFFVRRMGYRQVRWSGAKREGQFRLQSGASGKVKRHSENGLSDVMDGVSAGCIG